MRVGVVAQPSFKLYPWRPAISSLRSAAGHRRVRYPRSERVKALLDESADLTMNFETASKLKAVAFPSTMGSMAAVLEGRMELT